MQAVFCKDEGRLICLLKPETGSEHPCCFVLSRAGESLRSCPYFAVWSLDAVVEMAVSSPLLDVLVHERSLSRGLPFTCPPPEQFFNPTTYNFGEQ